MTPMGACPSARTAPWLLPPRWTAKPPWGRSSAWKGCEYAAAASRMLETAQVDSLSDDFIGLT